MHFKVDLINYISKSHEDFILDITAIVPPSYLFLLFLLTAFRLVPMIPLIFLFAGIVSMANDSKVRFRQATSTKDHLLAIAPILTYFTISTSILLPMSIYAALKMTTFGSITIDEINWWVLVLFAYLITLLLWYTWEKCSEALANTALCLIGVFLINWVAVTAIPATSAYLDQIGI